MLLLLDYLFAITHTLLVIFNLTGWIWPQTRYWHFWVINLTLFSWFGLGIFYGWGYCPFTDWHWQIKIELGETYLPASWIKYYVDKLTGMSWSALHIDIVVVICGLLAWILSFYFNRRDRKRKR